jgi:hypothetical protein
MYTFATSRFDPATLRWLPSVPLTRLTGFIKPFWVVNMCEGRKWIAHGLVLKDGKHICSAGQRSDTSDVKMVGQAP